MPNLASTSDPLGYDAHVDESDLDPTGRSATGLELLDAALVHRITCEQILMIDAPGGVVDFGINVLKWPGEVTTDADAAAKSPLIDEAFHRDPRVAKTDVSVSLAPKRTILGDGSEAALLVAYSVKAISGQVINRILGVSSVTVDFLASPT